MEFVASASNAAASAVTVNKPTGTAEGDLMVALCALPQQSAFWSAPAGWTSATANRSGAGGTSHVFWKVAGASEPSSYTFQTSAGGISHRALIVTYRGPEVSPFDAATSATAAAGTTATTSTVTTTEDRDLVLHGYAAFGVSAALTDDVATTDRAHFAGASPVLMVADETKLTAGVTTGRTATSGSSATGWHLWTVAFKSANNAPNAPTLVSPVGGVSIDLALTQRLSWTFSDPDSGDTQSAFSLRYRPAAGGAWTVVTGSTPNNYYDLPAFTLTAGDYEWQVATRDALGTPVLDADLVYSASGFFTAATVSNDITITAPTNGATISTETITVTWSTPTQTHYQLRVVADLAGVPDTSTVIYDTGEIASSSARSRQVSYPDNGVTRHTQVRKKQDGLWSDWASVSNPVSYTQPAVPGVTVDDTSQPGAIQVQASHPTPSGSEPTVTYMDVWRRETDDTSAGIRVATELAPTGIFTDWFVASGVSYAYRAQAWGDNQTSSYSEWSEDGSGEVVEEIDGGDADTDFDAVLDGGAA